MTGSLLVTGGLGFIGRAVVDRALTEGWSVRVLDSLRPDVHGEDPDGSARPDWATTSS